MKKIITSAALFAASSALASASTVLTLDSTALSTAGGTYSVSGTTIGSGYGNLSVSVVFDTDAFNTLMKGTFSTKKNLVYATGSASSPNIIGVKYDGYSSVNTSGLFGIWTTSFTTYSLTEGSGNGSNYIGATGTSGQGLNAFFTANTVTAAAMTFTTSSSGATVYLTLQTSDGKTTELSGSNSSLKSSTFGSLASLTYDTSYISYMTIDNTVLSATDAAKQNAANILAAAIPEPSAFGLLAGIGALALAVSRRRRSR